VVAVRALLLVIAEFSFFRTCTALDIAGLTVRVLSIADLIRAKRAAGPKDLAILPELEAILELKTATQE
jgi:hypothetical protein